MEKVSLPKGTRDFGPAQMAKRQFIIDSIRKVFQKYGFQPLETPAMENLSTLTGKYGDEGDQLLFRIKNSGDFNDELRRLIKISGTEFREIFDRVYQRSQDNNSIGPVTNALTEEIDKFKFSDQKKKKIFEIFIEPIAKGICEWMSRPL